MNNELGVTFKWEGGTNLGNLLPTEINRILNTCAEQLAKAAGKPLSAVAFEFQGRTHNVPISEAAKVGS